MNRILFDKKSFAALEEWAAKNKNYVTIDDYFFKKCELHFQGLNVVAYVEATFKRVKINIKQNKKQVVKCNITRHLGDDKDYDVQYSTADEMSREDGERLAVLVATAFFEANGFLFFGNMLDERKINAAGRNVGDDKVIVFRQYRERYYAIPVNAHRSPEGVFSVRGHIRHYKNGRNIWIEPYMKGIKHDEI